MLTVDASVFVSSLRLTESHSAESNRFLERLRRDRAALVCPTLALTETVAAIARPTRDTQAALQAGLTLDGLTNLRLVSLDADLARQAAKLAATHYLRGADAVYLAVAQHNGSTLITWDTEMLQRGPAVLSTLSPTDWLAANP